MQADAMATLPAAPATARHAAVPRAPWPARLQERLDAAERAVAALRAVCEEPKARASLEARAACEGPGKRCVRVSA